jgi:hypothetical protein
MGQKKNTPTEISQNNSHESIENNYDDVLQNLNQIQRDSYNELFQEEIIIEEEQVQVPQISTSDTQIHFSDGLPSLQVSESQIIVRKKFFYLFYN